MAQDHVLGLTVHSLPEPGPAQAEEERRTRAGRWKMMALLLVCAAPVIASYFTYYVIRPEGRRNFGELINPQRPVPELLALDLQGRTHRLPELKGQWLLVSVGRGACGEPCQQQLYFQRQLRELMGKDRDRVERVWLVQDTEPMAPALQPALEGLTVLRVPAAELALWLQPGAGQTLEDHLYVIDPMGNWMMRFPAGMTLETAARAKRDLERLMRASASWDKAGR
jgi:hypothetical protein